MPPSPKKKTEDTEHTLEMVLKGQEKLFEKFEQLDVALRGDQGNPGVIQDVAIMKSDIDSLKTMDSRLLTLIGGFGTAVGAIIVVGVEQFFSALM